MPDQRDSAIDLMDQQRFAEAIPLFLRLIESKPDDWSLYYMVGQCFRYTNNFSDAIRYLEKAASRNPAESRVFLALGIANQLKNDYAPAIQALEHAVELDPGMFSAYNSLGLTYRMSGELTKALEWYSRAADGMVSAVTEMVHKDQDECPGDEVIDETGTQDVVPRTVEKMREILRSDPTYAIIKNNIGICFMGLGDIDSAREQFRESIEHIPDDFNYPEPYKNLESIS